MEYFYRRFEKDSLNKLYELLQDVTPLKGDCGQVCGAVCCKGGEGDGMILFPGEKEYFEGLEGFDIRRNPEYGYDYLVCGGVCDRGDRPFSCRIFPYFFYVSSDGSVRVAPDIRALGICPLADGKGKTDGVFLRRMRMCAKVIGENRELYGFVRRLSDIITDFGRLG